MTRVLVALLVAASLAGCASAPRAGPETDSDDVGLPGRPPMPLDETAVHEVGEITSMRWTWAGRVAEASFRFTLALGEANRCTMDAGVAAHPDSPGYWGSISAEATDGGSATDGQITGAFDAANDTGDPPLLSYHAAGVVASNAPSGDNDIAIGLTMSASFSGTWVVAIIVEDAKPWPTHLTANGTSLLDVRCDKSFTMTAEEGAQGTVASFDDGAGVGVSSSIQRAHIQAADTIAVDLRGPECGMRTVLMGAGGGVVTATGPGGQAETAIAGYDSTIQLQGGPGTYEITATRVSMGSHGILFYSFDGPLQRGHITLA